MTLVLDISSPEELVEIISDRLWTLGVMAIEELPDEAGRSILRTTVGQDRLEAENRITGLLSDVLAGGLVHVRWHEMSNEIAETWRDFARPVMIDADLVIVPAWQASNDADHPSQATVITIEPGATFGLGDHPTTRASLHLLKRAVQHQITVLDIGCGSGILGIASLVLGARTAYGIDINPAAANVSTDNAKANGVADRWQVRVVDIDHRVIDELLEMYPDGFGVITANILAPVLIGLAPFFQRLLAVDGILIISGVLMGQFDHVRAALAPLAMIEECEVEGWAAVSFRRQSATP